MTAKTIQLENAIEEVNFDTASLKFSVKNFGSENIKVSFDSEFSDDSFITITPGFAQIVYDNVPVFGLPQHYHNKIYIKGEIDTKVEVMQLWQI